MLSENAVARPPRACESSGSNLALTLAFLSWHVHVRDLTTCSCQLVLRARCGCLWLCFRGVASTVLCGSVHGITLTIVTAACMSFYTRRNGFLVIGFVFYFLCHVNSKLKLRGFAPRPFCLRSRVRFSSFYFCIFYSYFCFCICTIMFATLGHVPAS